MIDAVRSKFAFHNRPPSLRTLCLAVAGIILPEIFYGILISNYSVPPTITLIAVRLIQMALIIPAVRFSDSDLGVIGLRRSEILSGIRSGIIWSLTFGVIVAVFGCIMWIAGMNPLKAFGRVRFDTIWAYAFFFLLKGVVGPVAEEIFFRGVLYGFLRRWGFLAAVTLSNLVFIPLHGTFGVNQIVGGVLFCVAYEFRGNLIVPICIHILGNSAICALSAINGVIFP